MINGIMSKLIFLNGKGCKDRYTYIIDGESNNKRPKASILMNSQKGSLSKLQQSYGDPLSQSLPANQIKTMKRDKLALNATGTAD